jgi:hypothetical protein
MLISKLLVQSSKYDTLSYQEKSEGIIKFFYFYYCLQKSLLIIFQVTHFCDLFNLCVRYHDDGSKELSACIGFILMEASVGWQGKHHCKCHMRACLSRTCYLQITMICVYPLCMKYPLGLLGDPSSDGHGANIHPLLSLLVINCPSLAV